MIHPDADILEVDPVTGRKTGLARAAIKALEALKHAQVPHAVIGATALAVRGLPRMTRDLDVVVLLEDAFRALEALHAAGFRSLTPIDRSREPEAMYVLESREGGIDVDLPEMLQTFRERVEQALHPPPPFPRPRGRRKS